MKCHKCNQDSIKIYVSDLDDIHIICDICGLDIECGDDNPPLCELFIYNENLDNAEKLGAEAYSIDSPYNPYSSESDQLVLHKAWEEGYNREKIEYEYSALSFSAEKIEKELRAENKKLILEKSAMDSKIDTFLEANGRLIEDFCSKLLGRKIIGKILNKVIISFRKNYKSFIRDVWGTWRQSD